MTCNGDCNQGRECNCEDKMTKQTEALAEQPKQEPVAWQALCGDNHYAYGTAEIDLKGYHSDFWQRPLYTHPPKQWQSLTKEEVWKAVMQDDMNFVQAFDKALREKNT
jgi:hypothetical protein